MKGPEVMVLWRRTRGDPEETFEYGILRILEAGRMAEYWGDDENVDCDGEPAAVYRLEVSASSCEGPSVWGL